MPDHQIIIVEFNLWQWARVAEISLDKLLAHISIFAHAHLAADVGNTITVYGAFEDKVEMLLSTLNLTNSNQFIEPSQIGQAFQGVARRFANSTKQSISVGDTVVASRLVAALAQALLFSNRVQNSVHQRILIFAPLETELKYVDLMNCVFAAQKHQIVIDLCLFGRKDSDQDRPAFLQQAPYLTNGICIVLPDDTAVLQTLFTVFLTPTHLRKQLRLPTSNTQNKDGETVDLRAACFCHRKVIDIGYVCSVCLSSKIISIS